VSFEETSKPLIAKLQHDTDAARAQARPIKVAVIWRTTDLGTVRPYGQGPPIVFPIVGKATYSNTFSSTPKGFPGTT
jgi:hypothetical protein